jgi:hypothetical protein
MDMDKPLSQMESKLVSDWLRREKKFPVSNASMFWRKRPSLAAEWLRTGFKVPVTAEDIIKAAGREEVAGEGL